MVPDEMAEGKRRAVRRDLLRRYMRLQQDLLAADPDSAAYQNAIQAFRQMGYALITAGFEDDLDRLLRIRVLDGGQSTRRDPRDRAALPELLMMEMRSR